MISTLHFLLLPLATFGLAFWMWFAVPYGAAILGGLLTFWLPSQLRISAWITRYCGNGTALCLFWPKTHGRGRKHEQALVEIEAIRWADDDRWLCIFLEHNPCNGAPSNPVPGR